MRPSSLHCANRLPPPPALRVREDALFLDLDGTLLEIAERPDHVAASAELLALLKRLALAMDGAVALLTGRTIADADAILGGAIADIAGVHGFELRRARASVIDHHADQAALAAARPDAHALANALHLLLEDKGASLALHFRNAPHRADQARSGVAVIAERHGLRALEGRMVVELIAGDRTKGDALTAFMAQAPFARRRPIAVGDDVTDEHAFEAATVKSGFGVLVGAARHTAATHALANPTAVFTWLKSAVS